MILGKKRVGLVVAILVTALAGLVLVQGILLMTTLESKNQAFHRNVTAALDQVVGGLEAGETMTHAMKSIDPSMAHIEEGRTQTVRAIAITSRRPGDSALCPAESLMMAADSCSVKEHVPLVSFKNDTLKYSVLTPQHVRITYLGSDSGQSKSLVDTFRTVGEYTQYVGPDSSKGKKLIKFEADSSTFIVDAAGPSLSEKPPNLRIYLDVKGRLVQRVLSQLITAEFEPIEHRLDSMRLDSLLRSSLKERGIETDLVYGVISKASDSIKIIKPSGYETQLRNSEFKARLFPGDILGEPSDLMVFFPSQKTYVWLQMVPLLAATLLFMTVVVLCFAYAVRVIGRQRRFAGRMIDFINNMTHEFKTPLSTVSLASEAIARPDVAADAGRLERFNKMIMDEASRMRAQVDKILQMAVLEEGDYELSLSEVDVHAVISKAVENAALHAEAKHGSVGCDLRAGRSVIMADRVHLANIIYNLLDNAIKYSPDKPEVIVATRNSGEGIVICVQDHGIGLSEEDREQVFDRYYRVTSGNVHNVKGFGLGLSYVKLMVQAHDGDVKISSTLGKGTTVEIYLPWVGPRERST